MHRREHGAWWFSSDGSGFDGVRYFLRNDPTATLIGIALFGPAGERNLPVLSTLPVDEATLDEAAHTFGIQVVPLP